MTMVVLLFSVMTTAIAQKKVIFQILIDPKMMIEGPYEESKNGKLDLVLKLGRSRESYEVGLFVNRFKALSYNSAGVYYNRKINIEKFLPVLDKFELSGGLDTGFIHRIINSEKNYSFTASLNAELKYFMKENFGVVLLSNYRYRGGLVEYYNTKNPMLFSGYFGVFYKF